MTNAQVAILIKDFDRKLDTIIEGQSVLATKEQLRQVDKRLIRVENTLDVAVRVLTEHSGELKDHDKRITRLEATAH